MDAESKSFVAERAARCCEYCLLPESMSYQPFHVEHVVALKHGGSDELSNLALACRNCNLHKGPNLSGIDPDSGEIVALFNPRVDRWLEHFVLEEFFIKGRTARGRATVRVLAMNDEDQIAIREAVGRFGAE